MSAPGENGRGAGAAPAAPDGVSPDGFQVGRPLDRVDGPAKVTGAARYPGDMPVDAMAHGYMVTSTVPRGRITSVDTSGAEAAPGVVRVFTHETAPRLPDGGRAGYGPPGGRRPPLLQDDHVRYAGQPVALVVADTFEHARDAAPLVRILVQEEPSRLDMEAAIDDGDAYAPAPERMLSRPPDTRRGDPDAALADAEVRLDLAYSTPMEHHNPMEPHATLAWWGETPDGPHLTVHDSTQGVWTHRKALAATFGVPEARVRVISRFVGGGFGCKGSVWSHVVLAAMAARELERPVRVVVTRAQMFTTVGHRPRTLQRVEVGARRDGTLTAVRHATTSHTSRLEDWVEASALVTRMLYASESAETRHRLVQLDLPTPTFMRAPGESTGSFALESALDELAWELGMDPVELRIRNHADVDPSDGRPFTSKSLKACYEEGARRFGWSRRAPEPRATRDGDAWVGWGMASATYPARCNAAGAVARLLPDGGALVRAGTQDIGTGTYTIMTQVAADALGLPPERVRFELGDTDFPETPISGGSMTAASAGSAVLVACRAVRERVARLAVEDEASPLHGCDPDDVRLHGGSLVLASEPSRREAWGELAARHGEDALEARGETGAQEDDGYARHAFGAVFVEARVDADLGTVRVPRVVGVYGIGRPLNLKTTHSQLVGGITWGLGMALEEHTLVDGRSGRIVNADLGEYQVPVNADVGSVDVSLVEEHDPRVNALGIKGVGEIGITGVAAAVANAVYHATGRRVRDLPITLDKLLDV